MYALNDPLNLVDPNGRESACISFARCQGWNGSMPSREFAQRASPGIAIAAAGLAFAGAWEAGMWALTNPGAATALTEAGAGLVPGMEAAGIGAAALYAQRTFSETFSNAGQAFFRESLGVPVQTIDDLAGAIRAGDVNAGDIPIQTITREGQEYILNNRSAQALDRAGVPRDQWNRVDMTGNADAEARLTGQLERNQLTPPAGCSTPTGSRICR